MFAVRDTNEVLNREFLEIRGRILELAAALDRIDRAPDRPGHPPDPRIGQLRQALEALSVPEAGRAETIQRIFSLDYDPHWRKHMGLEGGKR